MKYSDVKKLSKEELQFQYSLLQIILDSNIKMLDAARAENKQLKEIVRKLLNGEAT